MMKRTPDLSGFEWTTPFIADACVQLGVAVRIGPPGLRPMLPGTRIAGRACPCRHTGSVDVFLEAAAEAHRGDVLVIDNDGRLDEGCIGDLAAGEAREAGLAGVIVWGAHRDTSALLALGIRLWSLGTCPAGPLELRERSPKALVSARLGADVVVTRDDVMFADDDGVVVVEASKVDGVIESAKDIATREQAHATKLLAGALLRDQFKLDAYLSQRRGSDVHFPRTPQVSGWGDRGLDPVPSSIANPFRPVNVEGYVALLLREAGAPMRRLSITAVSVLQAIANGYHYGFDVIDQTGLPSGTVYPALGRLERDGLVRSSWEDESSAHQEGRPARRYYRLTAPGTKALEDAAAFYRALLPSRPAERLKKPARA